MSDWSELSMQDYELNYILNKFGKRQTQLNRDTLKELERDFKTSIPAASGNGLASMATKSYTKDEFYNWLKLNRSAELKSMQNSDLQR